MASAGSSWWPGHATVADVLDRVSDLYLACDDEWRLTLVNARAAEYLRLLGPGRPDPIGRSIWDVIPGLVGSRFQAEAFRAMVEQTEIEFEGFFGPLKRWFSVRLTPTADGIVACVRDVTGWRQTRHVLTREAERLAAVIETQQAVATADPDLGAVMRVVAERLQALTRAGAAGVFVPAAGSLMLCEASGSGRERIGISVSINASLVGECYRTGELIRCDDLTVDPRADRTAIETLGARSGILVPLKGEHGVQAVVAIWSGRPHAFNDLHVHTIRLVAGLLAAALERAAAFAANQLLLVERTASLAAIEGAEERFRTLVESIDDVVFRLDRDQRCVDIFGRWLEREGFEPADFLGRTHPRDRRAEERGGPRARQSPCAGRRDGHLRVDPSRPAAACATCRPRSRRFADRRTPWPVSWASGATSRSGSRPSSRCARRRRWRRSGGSPAASPTTSTT